MRAPLEIRAAGAYASIQDTGRFGHRRIGVPVSGTLAPDRMRLANRLVGNPAGNPVIECFDGGQHFVAGEVALRLAVAGDVRLGLDAGSYPERRTPTPWRSFLLEPGQALRIVGSRSGRIAIVAATGLQALHELGSASCYARAGLAGRALAAGDLLRADPARRGREYVLPQPPAPDTGPIRVVLGPQQGHFTRKAINTLLSTEYRVGEAADRMGMRLDGPTLAHRKGRGEIVSDATVPGAIQVPGDGRPIVLLADGQTAGGYPKIATVVSCDLPKLANRRPGETLRFTAVTAEAGEQASRDADHLLQAQCDGLRPFTEGGVDLEALYQLDPAGGPTSTRGGHAARAREGKTS